VKRTGEPREKRPDRPQHLSRRLTTHLYPEQRGDGSESPGLKNFARRIIRLPVANFSTIGCNEDRINPVKNHNRSVR
jgi:hypothetical protein